MIKFTNNKREQVEKPIDYKEVLAYLADIPVVVNNNSFLFENNIEYEQAKFMQDNKMTKKSI